MFSRTPEIRRGSRTLVTHRAVLALVATALLPMATGCDSAGADAGRWRLDYVSVSRDARVVDIAAVAEDEGWALSTEKRKDGSEAGFLLHRNGATWRRAGVPRPLRSEGGTLAGAQLEASGPRNVWLFGDVGRGGGPGALRWDGRQWRRTTVDFYTRDVAVLAPDDVWALDASSDRPLAHHWDGTRWTGHPLPTDYVDRLSASGPDDVWAVGDEGEDPSDRDVRHARQPAIVHFDGEKWRQVTTPEYHSPKPKPDEKAKLTEVVALSPGNAWAFGLHGYTGETGSQEYDAAFALHWDGSHWRKVPKAFDSSGASANELAVSATGDGAGGLVLGSKVGSEQHRAADGTQRLIKDPKPVAGRSERITETDRRQHFELHDLQLVPGTRTVWAVGAVGIPLHDGDAHFARGVIAAYSTGD
jgi:hypothetical protein